MQALFSGKDPQLVLFDLDGTLVDSVPDLAQAVDRMRVALGYPAAGVKAASRWVGNGAEVLVRRALDDATQNDVSEAQFSRGFELFLAFYGEATADQSVLYPGVMECLQGLQERRVRMGVVTNKPMRFTETMLAGFGLSGFFSVVYGGDSFPVKKPDPRPLLEAMTVCSVQPAQTLMVGDSINDVRAARAAGCPVICVPYGYNHGRPIATAEPDRVVDSLVELLG